MTRSLADGAARLGALGNSMRGTIPKAAVTAAALTVKTTTTAQMRTLVPSGRLRNVGKRGATLSVRYTVTGTSAFVRAEGPWQLIEGDLNAHQILPHDVGRLGRKQVGGKLLLDRSKAGRHDAKQRLYDALYGSSGFSGSHPLRTPYGPRYRVNMPVVHGHHPWAHGVEIASPLITQEMRAAYLAEALKVLL